MAKTGDSGKEWNYTEHVATRVDPRTHDRYEAYLDQLDEKTREPVTQAEAHRRLLRAGLDELLDDDDSPEKEPQESEGIPLHDLALILAAVGAFVWLGGNPDQWVKLGTILLGVYGVLERWVFTDRNLT